MAGVNVENGPVAVKRAFGSGFGRFEVAETPKNFSIWVVLTFVGAIFA